MIPSILVVGMGVVEKGEPEKCRSPGAGVGEEVVKSPARSCREEAG